MRAACQHALSDTMIAHLRSLPVLVLFLAALESVLVRVRLPWRDLGAELFLQASVLWFVAGLLALVPAWLTSRLISRVLPIEPTQTRRRAARASASMLAWMAMPVALHSALDRHTGLAHDVSALRSVGPWIEVLGVACVVLAVAAGLALLVRRVGAWGIAVPGYVAAAVAGTLLPFASAPEDAHGAAPVPVTSLTSDSTRPNLLLIVWDTCRSDRLEPYGQARATTPHLADFASSAIVFESAVSAATFTFSSHLTMLTGRYPSSHGARLLSPTFDPSRADSIAETLRSSGYRTGAFVGTDVLAGRTGLNRGFDRYDDRVDPAVCDTYGWRLVHDLQSIAARLFPALRNNGHPHWFQTFQRPADEVLAAARDWIDDGDQRPWFCFVNLYDIHWPYLPKADGLALVNEYAGPLDGFLHRSDAWSPGYEITEEDKQHVLELYEAEILELDAVVDRFMRALDLSNGETAVLMTSDHGEAFGEGGRWSHEDTAEPELRIPMILRMPGRAPEGRRVSARVSGVDVAPTLLELAGIAGAEGARLFEGRSLLGEHAPARAIFVEDRDHLEPEDVRIVLYRDQWKLRRSGFGASARFELNDLSSDAWGTVDVAADHPALLEELQALMAERRDELDEEEGDWSADASGMSGAADGLQALGYAGDE